MNLSASKVHHTGLVQGLCRAFIMAFVYVVPLFELMARPVRGCLCLFGSGLWHCSIAPCSPQGKSSLHCPTLQALSVTGEGWIGDQKNLFSPPLSGYIYSGSLWRGTMPHTNYTRQASFDLWDLGRCICAIIETKSFSSHVFKVEQEQKSLPTEI